MEKSKNGKRLTISVICVMMMIMLGGTMSTWIIYGVSDIAIHIIRFFVSLLLCYYLYKGYNWSKVIIIIVSLLALILFKFAFKDLKLLWKLYPIFFIEPAAYAYCGITLIVSKGIKNFMRQQRSNNIDFH